MQICDMEKPDSLILLMPKLEGQFFANRIHVIAPRLQLSRANSRRELDRAMSDCQGRINLFGFMTKVIVPASILERLNKTFNVHPGPPTMPGFRPTHTAHDQGITDFGVTLHQMNETVDAGPIIAVRKFEIPAAAKLEAIETQAYQQSVHLALEYLDMIVGIKPIAVSETEKWSSP